MWIKQSDEPPPWHVSRPQTQQLTHHHHHGGHRSTYFTLEFMALMPLIKVMVGGLDKPVKYEEKAVSKKTRRTEFIIH